MKAVIYLLLMVLLVTPALASDWNMFKKDASHSGFAIDTVNPPLTLKWSSNLGYSTDSSPVVADGILYIGSSYGIHAIDAVSGKEIWKYHSTKNCPSIPKT